MRELFLIETQSVRRYTDVSISQLQETLESSDGLFWLDIEQMTDEDASFLAEFKECRFHPLSIEECRNAEGRPKINEFSDYLFLNVYTLDDYTQDMTRLYFFLTPNFLITVHSTPLPFLQQVKDQIEQDYLLMRSPGYCMAMILNAMVSHIDPSINQLGTDIAAFENKPFNTALIQQLNQKKQDILILHRSLSRQRDLMYDIFSQGNTQMQSDTIIQVRDIYHRLAHHVDMLEYYRDVASNLRDGALAGISSQLQETTQRLSMVTIVFLPLICLAALFGINNEVLGASPFVSFFIALIVLSVVGGAVLMLTGRKD